MSHDDVKEYYGKTLQSTSDLKTNCCCTNEKMPKELLDALNFVHEDVQNHYYGCGLVIPTDLEGITAIDLGSGAGRDCYILSKLVGEKGHVIGVDMTEEQLTIANKYIDHHTKLYDYAKPNVEFVKGYIEKLNEIGIKDETVDVIVSNCVINLCPNKEDVLKECFRILKKGGEMYFSDVYSDKRVPEELRKDKVLLGECISGALYWNDFLSLARKVGFSSPRLVKSRLLTISNEEIRNKVNGYKFYSATYRLVKCDQLESGEEDFGDIVTYKGNGDFVLDKLNVLPKDIAMLVSRNTFNILRCSRYGKLFEFKEGKQHLGIFDDKLFPFAEEKKETKDSCCSTKKPQCCCGKK